MSLHEYLQEDPGCTDLLRGAVLAVGPMLADPDPAPVEAVVAGWAFDLAGRMPLPWNLHAAIDVLNRYLFQEQGLQGDRDNYDDPRNAALPLVLGRRRGLPIALAILWLETARRLGFPAVAVALPGHFITGLELELGTLYFDPFHGGQALGEEAISRLLEQASGGLIPYDPVLLRPVNNRAVLVRLVRNLHVRYMRRQAWSEALWTATHLVLLAPDPSQALRDRALVHFQRGEMSEGLADLSQAVRLDPDLEAEARQWLEKLQGG